MSRYSITTIFRSGLGSVPIIVHHLRLGDLVGLWPNVIEAVLELDPEEVGHPGLHRGPKILGALDPVLARHLGKLDPRAHELNHTGIELVPRVMTS